MRHSFRSRVPVLLVATAALLALGGCGDDDDGGTGPGGSDVTVPAAWAGTWMIESTSSSPLRGGSSTEFSIDVICAGKPLLEVVSGGEDDLPAGITCGGTWTDTSADVSCTLTETVEGCTYTITFSLDLTRSGDAFLGTISETVESTDCPEENYADVQSISATRIDAATFGCESGLDDSLPASWGGTWDPDDGDPMLFCPGDSPRELFWPEVGVDETGGGFTETTAKVWATGVEPAGDCLVLHFETWDLVRSGDSITGTMTGREITVANPDSPGGSCTGDVTTPEAVGATRTSTDVSGCSGGTAFPDPARPSSWLALPDLRR